jgi:hypothetical protein
MVSEIPVDGFAAMNTDDDVSNKQSIRCTSSRRTSSGRGESVSIAVHRQRMLLNSKETW